MYKMYVSSSYSYEAAFNTHIAVIQENLILQKTMNTDNCCWFRIEYDGPYHNICIMSYILYTLTIGYTIGICCPQHSHGCNFKHDMNFSNLRRRISSAPYFPCVPLSTSKKYACRLFNTANFDLL